MGYKEIEVKDEIELINLFKNILKSKGIVIELKPEDMYWLRIHYSIDPQYTYSIEIEATIEFKNVDFKDENGLIKKLEEKGIKCTFCWIFIHDDKKVDVIGSMEV